MSIQDDFSLIKGTDIVWKSSGGDKAITCTSLAAGSSRLGDKSATLLVAPPGLSTTVLPDYLEFKLLCQFTSAPTAGGEVGLYLAWSDSATAGTNNPAGTAGADAAGPNTDTFGQLAFVGSLIASNNLGTAVQGPVSLWAVPKDYYFSPLIYNNASVAFDATALHTVLTCTPWYRVRST